MDVQDHFNNFSFVETPTSSNVVAFGYNPFSKVLRVQFGLKTAYDYAEVSINKAMMLHSMMQLPKASIGKYIHASIKPIHPCIKVNYEQ